MSLPGWVPSSEGECPVGRVSGIHAQTAPPAGPGEGWAMTSSRSRPVVARTTKNPTRDTHYHFTSTSLSLTGTALLHITHTSCCTFLFSTCTTSLALPETRTHGKRTEVLQEEGLVVVGCGGGGVPSGVPSAFAGRRLTVALNTHTRAHAHTHTHTHAQRRTPSRGVLHTLGEVALLKRTTKWCRARVSISDERRSDRRRSHRAFLQLDRVRAGVRCACVAAG